MYWGFNAELKWQKLLNISYFLCWLFHFLSKETRIRKTDIFSFKEYFKNTPTIFYEYNNSIDVSTYRQFTCTCILRALMLDVHHSLRYVTFCCVFRSSFTHCNFKEFLCRFNGRSFEVFLKRRKTLELWKISFVCEFQGWTSFFCCCVYF